MIRAPATAIANRMANQPEHLATIRRLLLATRITIPIRAPFAKTYSLPVTRS